MEGASYRGPQTSKAHSFNTNEETSLQAQATSLVGKDVIFLEDFHWMVCLRARAKHISSAIKCGVRRHRKPIDIVIPRVGHRYADECPFPYPSCACSPAQLPHHFLSRSRPVSPLAHLQGHHASAENTGSLRLPLTCRKHISISPHDATSSWMRGAAETEMENRAQSFQLLPGTR